MGLIKAVLSAGSTTLADQWKEFFICEAIPNDTLLVKGEKRTSKKSSNTKGSDNIITNGSVISVADGQCMIIVDQGKIVEVCAEPGAFTWDASTEPSIFTGNLGDSIKESFKTWGKRITFGGDTGHDQRIYYVNTKEILDNKFGTTNAIPFRVVDSKIGLDIDVSIRCNGIYSFRITDPVVFYSNITGNVSDEYKMSDIAGQLKTEFVDGLQPAVAKLSDLEIRPNQIPGHVEELKTGINEALKERWGAKRGMTVENISMNPITLSDEDQELIKNAQRTAMYKDPTMAAAKMVDAQSEAMVTAAGNQAGAMTGFLGMGMAMNAGGANNAQALFEMGQQQQAQAQAANAQAQAGAATATAGSWTCSCGTVNTGNFCTNCGGKKPEVSAPAFCPNCGNKLDPQNPAKFCPNCGSKVQ